jgi:hypothetical protein
LKQVMLLLDIKAQVDTCAMVFLDLALPVSHYP